MAGLGKKTFTAGEVLTAADVNGYLMEQSVMVFGGTAARSSAIPTPSEGMVTYLSDLNDIQAYNGSSWISTGLTAGTTTANYGWPIPASGSIASLGTAIDTTVAALPAGALELVSTQTLSASSGISFSSLTVGTKYRLIWRGYTSADNVQVQIQFRENTTNKGTGYYGGRVGRDYAGTNEDLSINNANFVGALIVGKVSPDYYVGQFELEFVIHSLEVATATLLSMSQYSASFKTLGFTNKAMTNCNGITIYPASGTMTGSTSLFKYNV